jgi:hypothetical protein
MPKLVQQLLIREYQDIKFKNANFCRKTQAKVEMALNRVNEMISKNRNFFHDWQEQPGQFLYQKL